MHINDFHYWMNSVLHLLNLKVKYKPVKLCNPAPSVDRNEPIKITHSFGHDSFATTKPPSILSPNLKLLKT